MPAQRKNRQTSDSAPSAVPGYDGEAIRRISSRVSLKSIQLVGVYFTRSDDGPFPAEVRSSATPEIALSAEWKMSPGRDQIGAVMTFGTVFESEEPYELVAKFRALYTIDTDGPTSDQDVDVFVHWNALFNVWPYWREYVSSTINRAQLAPFLVPVMRVDSPGPVFEAGTPPRRRNSAVQTTTGATRTSRPAEKR